MHIFTRELPTTPHQPFPPLKVHNCTVIGNCIKCTSFKIFSALSGPLGGNAVRGDVKIYHVVFYTNSTYSFESKVTKVRQICLCREERPKVGDERQQAVDASVTSDLKCSSAKCSFHGKLPFWAIFHHFPTHFRPKIAFPRASDPGQQICLCREERPKVGDEQQQAVDVRSGGGPSQCPMDTSYLSIPSSRLDATLIRVLLRAALVVARFELNVRPFAPEIRFSLWAVEVLILHLTFEREIGAFLVVGGVRQTRRSSVKHVAGRPFAHLHPIC
ncbi:hypothetical protein DFH09DRAFT_1079115 [Mycena vulgaris]|nr:hypothetical protein DFH09DRAFT_1079115 [Mycena vulgaris]